MVAGRRSLAPAGCGAPVRGLAVRPCLVPICGLAPPHCLAPIRHLAPPGTPNACRAQRSAGVSAKTRDLVLGTLVPLFVLNALLVFGNAWPTLWPRPTLAVSIELAFAVAALALAAAWRGRVPPALVRTLAGLVTLWVVLRYVQVTVPALFGRPLNLYWDLPHLGAVLDMGGDGSGARIVLAAALGTLVVLALHRVVSACVRALARGAGAPARGRCSAARRARRSCCGRWRRGSGRPPNRSPHRPSRGRSPRWSSIRSASCARRSPPTPPTGSAPPPTSAATSRRCAVPTC